MVAADVQNPHQPKTATGVIVEALARRKAAGLPAFTVMSCDNMPETGHVMRDVVTSYAKAVDVKLAQWIEDNVTFPSTMAVSYTHLDVYKRQAECGVMHGYRADALFLSSS